MTKCTINSADIHDIISAVIHSMMKCFSMCVAVLLSVFISYSSAELTEFLWSDDEVSGKYGNNNGSIGIKFVCQPEIMSIETFENITLVNFSSAHFKKWRKEWLALCICWIEDIWNISIVFTDTWIGH